jgi:hypothetical protein
MQKLLDPLLSSHSTQHSSRDVENSTLDLPAGDSSPHAVPRSGTRRVHRWTRVHSHYAVMGGYVLDTTKLAISFTPHQSPRLTLSADGFLYLAQHAAQLVPDISAEHIHDKSKADGFAKTIVCTQALWFLAQVVGRLATSHPISLLEMNTLLHSLCCLIIYAAWWRKPLGIVEPSTIDPMGALEMCSSMIWKSRVRSMREYLLCGTGNTSESTRVILRSEYESHTPLEQFGTLWEPGDLEQDSEDPQYRRLYLGQTFRHNRIQLYCTRSLNPRYRWVFTTLGYIQSFFGNPNPDVPDRPETCYIRLSPGDIKLLTDVTSVAKRVYYPNDTLRRQAPLFFDRNTILDDWPDSFQSAKFTLSNLSLFDIKTLCIVGLLVASSLYGGVHLLAWHYRFPSTTEKYFWPVSCFTVVSPLFLMLLLIVAVIVFDYVYDWLAKKFRKAPMELDQPDHERSTLIQKIVETGFDAIVCFLLSST